MCVAIVLPAGRKISAQMIAASWMQNDDGAGFAYADGGKVVLNKGHMTLGSFMNEFQRARAKFEDRNFLLHFRIRSKGAENAENTHPYVYKHGVMIHNGTLNGTGAQYHTGKSDTAMFLDKFGDSFTYDFLSKNKSELGTAIAYNKLAFLFPTGQYVIINEKNGQWQDDVWYSNNFAFNRARNMPTDPQQCVAAAEGRRGAA